MYVYDIPIWNCSSILTRYLSFYRKFNIYIKCYGPSYASVPVTKTRPAGAMGTG